MKHRGLKFLFLLLSLALLVGLLSGMSAYAEDYPIWIGDKRVTDENTSGDGWSYNKDTKTLTLDGFSCTANIAENVHSEDYDNGCIFIGSSSDSITIELKGENRLTNNINNTSSGIFSRSALIFSGSGSLIVSSKGDGICSRSTITVDRFYSGNITADGYYTGLISDGVIEIGGGTVTANGNSAGIISVNENIIITGGTVTADGKTNGVGLTPSSSLKIDGGRVTASGGIGIYSSSVEINGDIVIASGSYKAIFGDVKNTIAGTGWTDAAGTGTEISTSNDGRELEYIKVQFPANIYTVTYAPGSRASLNPDAIAGLTIDDGNIVRTVTESDYIIEGFESCFIAPQGETFDGWMDQNGTRHGNSEPITLSGDLTLTAQWKKSGTDGGDSGSGSGLVDLVFNIPGADNSWEYAPGYAPQQAYRVSLAPMQGGSAALGLTTGDSGTALNVYPTSAVYVFPNADPGYTLDKIVWSLIDGSASYDITEAKNFVMPAMDVVVYVTFRPVG